MVFLVGLVNVFTLFLCCIYLFILASKYLIASLTSFNYRLSASSFYSSSFFYFPYFSVIFFFSKSIKYYLFISMSPSNSSISIFNYFILLALTSIFCFISNAVSNFCYQWPVSVCSSDKYFS